VKHDPTFWLLARSSGITAYVLLTLSVLAGLALGCVIDELVQVRKSSADQSSSVGCDSSRDSALIAASDTKLFR